jgi:hypothetical protein
MTASNQFGQSSLKTVAHALNEVERLPSSGDGEPVAQRLCNRRGDQPLLPARPVTALMAINFFRLYVVILNMEH